MLVTAQEVIAALRLVPLPGEGGFVRQTARDEQSSAADYLMTAADFSALHRLRADEVWNFHSGDAIEHVALDPQTGALTVTRLGANAANGEHPRLTVPSGVWQGARLAPNEAGASALPQQGWALVDCTVTPPWRDDLCELGERAALLREFPAAAEWIRTLTR